MPTPPQRTPAQTAPTAPAAPGVGGPPAGLEALQAQAADLTQQLAGLRAQRQVLVRQINAADGSVRGSLMLRRGQLEMQIAQVESDLQNVRIQIAAQRGVSVENVTQTGQVIVPPPNNGPFRRGVDPDMVVGMSFVLAMCVVLPVSIAAAKRIWRGKPKDAGPKVDEIAPRLDRLEHAVDAIAIEIERISEGQRFVTRVLVERPMQHQPVPAEAAQSSAIEEGRPLRALGAGPAEPIRVAERQGVKQAITPH